MKSGFVTRNFIVGFKPEDKSISIDQWADKYRFLSSVSSSEPGRYRTSRTPYAKRIMEELSPSSSVKKIVVQKGSQLGFSEIALNALGYYIDISPRPILYLLPTDNLVKSFNVQRVEPFLDSTPRVSNKISKKHAKTGANTAHQKTFPGGIWFNLSANSAANVCSMPIGVFFGDEVDRYPQNVDGEGDVIQLAEDRTKTFDNKKIYVFGTPTKKSTSIIEKQFLKSDQKYFYVPCPHCGKKQKLEFNNLRWNKENPDEVFYSCSNCGEAISEDFKTQMLEQGEWIAHKPEVTDISGFHINALYSPQGFYSWSDMVKKWLAAQKDVGKLQAFVNGDLGETWEERGDSPDWENLKRRSEDYKIGSIPKEALLLYAGVDVQRDRLECHLMGFGRNREKYSIEYQVFKGDTSKYEVWELLKKYLDTPKINHWGNLQNICKTAIDSGDQTQFIYHLIRTWNDDSIIAIKGSNKSVQMMPIGQMKSVDYRPKNQRRVRNGASFLEVYVSYLKREIYQSLALKEPLQPGDPYPNGYIHLPKYDDFFYEQLTSEYLIDKVIGGRRVYRWEVEEGKRNEVLDTTGYAIAVSYMDGINRLTDEDWDEIERQNSMKSKGLPSSHVKQNVKQEEYTKPAQNSSIWDHSMESIW